MALIADSIVVDGSSLTVESLMSIGHKTQLSLSEDAWSAVRKSRAVVDTIVSEGRTVYGINTGFGNFSEVVIPHDKLNLLQENLIRSHAAGVGNPMTPERTKRLLALRINVLAKGACLSRPFLRFPSVASSCACSLALSLLRSPLLTLSPLLSPSLCGFLGPS